MNGANFLNFLFSDTNNLLTAKAVIVPAEKSLSHHQTMQTCGAATAFTADFNFHEHKYARNHAATSQRETGYSLKLITFCILRRRTGALWNSREEHRHCHRIFVSQRARARESFWVCTSFVSVARVNAKTGVSSRERAQTFLSRCAENNISVNVLRTLMSTILNQFDGIYIIF